MLKGASVTKQPGRQWPCSSLQGKVDFAAKMHHMHPAAHGALGFSDESSDGHQMTIWKMMQGRSAIHLWAKAAPALLFTGVQKADSWWGLQV